MPITKTHAEPQSKAGPTPKTNKLPEQPEKKAGAIQAALVQQAATDALPPPNGKPSAARASKMMTSHGQIGAASRARMANGLQRSVGNARLSRMTSPGTQGMVTGSTSPDHAALPVSGSLPNSPMPNTVGRGGASATKPGRILPIARMVIQRKCACGGEAGEDGECAACKAQRMAVQRQASAPTERDALPPNSKPSEAIVANAVTNSTPAVGAIQRARMIQGMQSTVGNARVSRLLNNPVQAKLTVGAPNDPYEQEADRTANTVLRMMEPTLLENTETKAPAKSPIGLSSASAQRRPEEKVSRAVAANNHVMAKPESGQPQASSDLEQKLNSSKGNGSPLPKDTRASLESTFGADFSNVNIHTGADAVVMNKELGAQAFTHGSDIYFNEGKYAPESSSGKHLLAHELTHTVQQGGSALHAKKQAETPKGNHSKADVPNVQAAWYNFTIPGTDYEFDPSIEGIKNAANIAKDTVNAGVDKVKDAASDVKDAVVSGLEWIVDEIKGLVSSGIDWLREQWASIKGLAESGWESLKSAFNDILGFLTSPLSAIVDAITNFDADSLAGAWAAFKGIVTGVYENFKGLTDDLLQRVNGVWKGINGFAISLLNKVSGLTQNFLFKKLPDTLQKIAYTLIDQVRSLWKRIDDGWKKIFSGIKTWIDKALDTVFQFVLRVTSFAINVIIEGIRQFGELVLFLQDLFANPQKYIDILARKSVEAFDGVESRFSEIISRYFGEDKKAESSTAITGTIQRQPDVGADTKAKTSASWGEIGRGTWKMMGKKWNEFKANPLSVVTGLLVDMFFPIYGNVKDIIQLSKDIWKIVTGPLSAGSLEEVWTSFLQILDIPILIYHTVISILMRSLMVPLIVASFIPHPLVKGIAAAVGYALLGGFVEAELLNIGHKLLLLKTGATTGAQKEEAYNRIADSLIAMAMTAVIMLIMLILHFIANVMKGIYNFIKGKVFPVEAAPVEGKGGSLGEGKGKGEGGPEEGKGSKLEEAPKLEGEGASSDGQRSIKVTEKGKIWICASPCEEIRLKYEAQLKDNPNFNERIKALEEGYSDLSPEQKSVRDTQIKQLEQELADAKFAQEGGVRAAKEVKWPPEPPKGDKPPISAPDAAEWRYQRYVYEKFLEGSTPKEVLPPDEWMRRYFDPTAEGGRPGRPGGPEQVAAKKALAAEGVRIVENVELGGRYPDGIDPKPNPAGGKSYYEVGKMLDSGIPEARERVKIADEIKAMDPNDTVTFVDKTDVSKRLTYAKGSTPESPTSRTFKPGEK